MWVQDHLEPYFRSSDANPDVRENLERMKERVERVHQLTGSILQFSQTLNAPEHNEPLDRKKTIAALRFDFDLSAAHLRLTGDCKVVNADTINFRCVLDNLIGNAVTYHDGVRPLKITVAATQKSRELACGCHC